MNASLNINNIFFEGFYKDVWRKLIPAGLSEAEVDFIEEIGALQPGNKVLDLMCGYGRHALELGKRGYAVTAIDNLLDYIVEIDDQSLKQGLPVKPIHASALEVELDQEHDAAICMGNSFAFFNEKEALSVLQNISAHLKEGGIFLINTWMIGEIAIKYFQEKEWFYVEDYKYLIDNQYLFHPARIESNHIIIRADGATEVIKGVDYIFTLAELQALLQKAGLSIKNMYSTPRKRKFQFGDTRAYIVAEKLPLLYTASL